MNYQLSSFDVCESVVLDGNSVYITSGFLELIQGQLQMLGFDIENLEQLLFLIIDNDIFFIDNGLGDLAE